MRRKKLHLFSVSVDYNVIAYSAEEAETMYKSGDPTVVDVSDLGSIE